MHSKKGSHPQLAEEFTHRMSGGFPKDWEKTIQKYINELQANPAKIATRKASQNTLNAYGPMLPELLGGSADLAPSNPQPSGRSSVSLPKDQRATTFTTGCVNLARPRYRQLASRAPAFVPYTATFLMFVEYARNAARMAAPSGAALVYTHRLNWQAKMVRRARLLSNWPTCVTPGNSSARRATCDQVEAAVGWKLAVERHNGPTALILSRQNLA